MAMMAPRIHFNGVSPRIVGMTRSPGSGRSLPVTTASTPGSASAFEVSMLLM